MNDWFVKKEFTLFKNVKEYVDDWSAHVDDDNWVYEPWQAPGTRSIKIDIGDELHNKIKKYIKLPLYNEWYIWDFMSAKDLLIHKDSNSTGDYRSIAFIIPIEGIFENQIYKDDEKTLIDSVVYGPNECLILNNSRYFHGGKVLSCTRRTISCWVDFKETDSTKTLKQMIEEHEI